VHEYAVAVAPGTNGNADLAAVMRNYRHTDAAAPNAPAASKVPSSHNGKVERHMGTGSDENAPSCAPTGTAKKELPITAFLDGMHSFDEICSVLEADKTAVLERMRDQGEIQLISR